jgi:hypothetical protein
VFPPDRRTGCQVRATGRTSCSAVGDWLHPTWRILGSLRGSHSPRRIEISIATSTSAERLAALEKVWRALPIYAAVVKRTKHPFGSTRPNPPEPRIAT